MSFSATITGQQVDAANTALESQGFGPNNFSIKLRSGSQGATHVGLSCIADYTAFQNAVEALSLSQSTNTIEISYGDPLELTFQSHCDSNGLEWSDPSTWYETPIMVGDRRTKDGITWESLIDYNLWEPGVLGWTVV